ATLTLAVVQDSWALPYTAVVAMGADARREPVGALFALAVNATRGAVVAGSQAEALARARGDGAVAMALWPDARAFALLPQHALQPDPVPTYGRAPDARLPGVPA
ncbi:MAG: tRNA ((37)-N6)-threonylcarbamoyltransferase complex dimerization subunit type 1 TsaB, partial [Pseudomonadota bacterium]